jgi:hypothetical protein
VPSPTTPKSPNLRALRSVPRPKSPNLRAQVCAQSDYAQYIISLLRALLAYERARQATQSLKLKASYTSSLSPHTLAA